jgi:hypothetical protein
LLLSYLATLRGRRRQPSRKEGRRWHVQKFTHKSSLSLWLNSGGTAERGGEGMTLYQIAQRKRDNNSIQNGCQESEKAAIFSLESKLSKIKRPWHSCATLPLPCEKKASSHHSLHSCSILGWKKEKLQKRRILSYI